MFLIQSGVPGTTLIGVDFDAAVAIGMGAVVGREVAIGMDVAAGSGVALGKGVGASVAELAQAVTTSRITSKMIMRNCLSKVEILLIKLTPLIKLIKLRSYAVHVISMSGAKRNP